MRASRRASMVVLAAAVLFAVPAAGAGAITGLTLHKCFGGAAGCINVAGGPLRLADAVAVSRNGSVYVTGEMPDGPIGGPGFVSHFFGGKGGALSYDGCVSDDGDGGACADVPGSGTPLEATDGVAVSPNGRSVYVLNFEGTVSHLFANATQGQLSYDGCVSADGSGGLCQAGVRGGTGNPFDVLSGLAVSPNTSGPNSSVYMVSQDGFVSHLFANPTQGQLNYDGCVNNDGSGGTCTQFSTGYSPLDDAQGVAVSPSGKAVYVSSFEGRVSQLAASPSTGGQITAFEGCRNSDTTQGCLQGPVIGNPLSGAIAVAVSPNGGAVYVASNLAGTVSHFFADPTGAKLLAWDGCVSDDGSGGGCAKGPKQGAPLAGSQALAVSPDGKTVYSVSPRADSLSWFSVAPQGQITFKGCLSDKPIPGCTDPPGEPLDGADAVAVSPDSTTVYVASDQGGTLASFVVKTAPKPKPPLTLTYGPKPLHAGKRTTVTFHVTSKGKPVRHAQVKFAGRTGFTGVRGNVSFTLVLQHRTYTATATATGKKTASITLHPT
jgi:DNA-binding beta-propeller fold protein YncE